GQATGHGLQSRTHEAFLDGEQHKDVGAAKALGELAMRQRWRPIDRQVAVFVNQTGSTIVNRARQEKANGRMSLMDDTKRLEHIGSTFAEGKHARVNDGQGPSGWPPCGGGRKAGEIDRIDVLQYLVGTKSTFKKGTSNKVAGTEHVVDVVHHRPGTLDVKAGHRWGRAVPA